MQDNVTDTVTFCQGRVADVVTDTTNRAGYYWGMVKTPSPGDRLNALREGKRLSMEELGEAVGTVKQTIFKLEHGILGFSVDWARKLAAELGVEWTHFVDFLPDDPVAQTEDERELLALFRRQRDKARRGLALEILVGGQSQEHPPPGQRTPDIAPNQVAQGADISRRQLRGAGD